MPLDCAQVCEAPEARLPRKDPHRMLCYLRTVTRNVQPQRQKGARDAELAKCRRSVEAFDGERAEQEQRAAELVECRRVLEQARAWQ